MNARRAAPMTLALLWAAPRAAAQQPINTSAWVGLPYALRLLEEGACTRQPGLCERYPATVPLPKDARANKNSEPPCMMCHHGCYTLPKLVKQYNARTVAEIGVCTGQTSVAMLDLHGSQLDRYYLIDPWGGRRCHPGCACFSQLSRVAVRWPQLTLLRGYSTAMAFAIPNASLDLVLVDAAHDYRNARADMLAYWPKLKAGGVMAGHDFAHNRNWAEIAQDRAAKVAPFDKTREVPAYGVTQATQELFGHCEIHAQHNTFWIEKAKCQSGPLPNLAG